MFELENLSEYRENNRLEAKKASKGLPSSLWETYSAFSNTNGGVILLGVEELADKSLKMIGVSEAEKLIKDFWDTINNQNKVSKNICSEKHVYVKQADGKSIVVIEVPRAQRYDRPIFINGNPINGTYRRNGEGDYKCNKEEYFAMTRDAAFKTQDMLVLEELGLEAFNEESIRSYRMRMSHARPGHVWEGLSDDDFLCKIGAIGIGSDGHNHPTAAGLLMFGNEYEIVKEYPLYFLDYQEKLDENLRWTDRIVSSSGNWSGNIYDFYFKVYNKITEDIKVPFLLYSGVRVDVTQVHNALREALANCLINADYYGRLGVVVIKEKNLITFSNPGNFRIDINDAFSGGMSDPRNAVIMKMFNLINVGERAGSGIPSIIDVWDRNGWSIPEMRETSDPDRVTVSLEIETSDKRQAIKTNDKSLKSDDERNYDLLADKTNDKKQAIKISDKSLNPDDKRNCFLLADKTSDKKQAIKISDKIVSHKTFIVSYLKENMVAKSSELAKILNLDVSRVRAILSEMVKEHILISEGANKNRVYKLSI